MKRLAIIASLLLLGCSERIDPMAVELATDVWCKSNGGIRSIELSSEWKDDYAESCIKEVVCKDGAKYEAISLRCLAPED